MPRTDQGTDQGTDHGTVEIADDVAGSDRETLESLQETSEEPPCREAARHLVLCPGCGRQLQIKTLRYSHICGRSFIPLVRAAEQKKVADASILARFAQIEHRREQDALSTRLSKGTQERTGEQAAEHKQHHFSNFRIA